MSIIFTCTTFFDYHKSKWDVFQKALDSLNEKHSKDTLTKITKWIIVNEYSNIHKCNWKSLVLEKYPFVEFIQKNENQKGQAKSMNIILDLIKPFKYWIHWEEAWYSNETFLDDAITIMQNNDNISQLQFTKLRGQVNWLDVSDERLDCSNSNFCYVVSDKNIDLNINIHSNDIFLNWPLYSLLPSINRVDFYNFGYFSEDPKIWPIRFEYDFAKRWLISGGIKAVLKNGPVHRDENNHKSTYKNNDMSTNIIIFTMLIIFILVLVLIFIFQ